MPIRPQFRWFYPIDWRELSSVIRFERAQSRCEQCRRPHGRLVTHLGDGRWWDEAERTWRSGRGRKLKRDPSPKDELRYTRVMLATAHLDHDPTNNHTRNLSGDVPGTRPEVFARAEWRHSVAARRRRP